MTRLKVLVLTFLNFIDISISHLNVASQSCDLYCNYFYSHDVYFFFPLCCIGVFVSCPSVMSQSCTCSNNLYYCYPFHDIIFPFYLIVALRLSFCFHFTSWYCACYSILSYNSCYIVFGLFIAPMSFQILMILIFVLVHIHLILLFIQAKKLFTLYQHLMLFE